jgi:hypothetical protein
MKPKGQICARLELEASVIGTWATFRLGSSFSLLQPACPILASVFSNDIPGLIVIYSGPNHVCSSCKTYQDDNNSQHRLAYVFIVTLERFIINTRVIPAH